MFWIQCICISAVGRYNEAHELDLMLVEEAFLLRTLRIPLLETSMNGHQPCNISPPLCPMLKIHRKVENKENKRKKTINSRSTMQRLHSFKFSSHRLKRSSCSLHEGRFAASSNAAARVRSAGSLIRNVNYRRRYLLSQDKIGSTSKSIILHASTSTSTSLATTSLATTTNRVERVEL
jgi:hypothetical protein